MGMGSSYPVLVFFFFSIQTRHSEQPLQETVVGQHLQEAAVLEGPGGSWRVLEWASGSSTLRVQGWCHRPWHRLEKLSCTPSLQPLKSIINNHIIIYGNVYVCFLVSKKKKLIALNLNILDFDKQTKHTIDKRFTQSKAGHIETVGV